MEIKNISVVGGGTMGNGIVTVFAVNDYNVNLIELNQEAIDKALKNINSNLERMLKKESITNEQKLNALNKIKTFQDVEAIPKNSDLVIEAVYENKEIKSKILNKINKIVKDDSIIASNTSSISITELSND
jgi:3-hydroxybutyryl-CoA dehydrogenase